MILKWQTDFVNIINIINVFFLGVHEVLIIIHKYRYCE